MKYGWLRNTTINYKIQTLLKWFIKQGTEGSELARRQHLLMQGARFTTTKEVIIIQKDEDGIKKRDLTKIL